jgi:hypothetical protein
MIDPRTGYVAFLDSDQLWERDALERLIRTFNSGSAGVWFEAQHGPLGGDW